MEVTMGKTLAVALAFTALLVPVRAQALENEVLLALVAMPLAIAAVSEVAEIPAADLVDVVTLMNDAEVPPPQFLEVVRYVPVALVSDAPAFIHHVRLREAEGLRGAQLVASIEDRLRLYDVDVVKLDIERPRVVDIDESFFPAVVRTRLAEVKQHPHGGPPGRLKKAQGAQTGAEIVHSDERRARPKKVIAHREDDRGRGRGHGQGRGRGKD
jgi:hypothetical protein